MSRSSLAPWLGIPVVLVAGCAGWDPTAEAPDGGTVEERVRAPSAGSADELQVFGVRNQAVVALGRQAKEAEASGDLERAEMLLERALRIDGRDPQVLQQMAEVQLARGHLDQAGSFASRAFELGPQVGEICERSLRTLIVVHERSQQSERARRTRERLDSCRVAPPERF
ncbi:MAG: tetratricopeptide repeat protein [Wenzhouxiangellaceae bacterium]|nr:tetratricopeptide repeat protein [Wenzhouxiangellaceae bacterium]